MARKKRGIRKEQIWWCVSIGLQVGIILAVLYVEPVQRVAERILTRLTSGRSKTEWVVWGDRLQKIVNQMTELQREKAARTAQRMEDIMDQMIGIRDRSVASLEEAKNTEVDLAAIESDLNVKFDEPKKVDVESLDLPDVFEFTCSVEQFLVQYYKEIRSAGMAQVNPDLTMAEAFDSTQVVRPVRADIKPELFRASIRDPNDPVLEQFKAELKLVGQELKSMEEYATKLLEFAIAIEQQKDGMSVDIYADSELYSMSYSGPELMPDEIYDSHAYSMGSFNPIPGRKFLSGGDENLWFFIDQWWVIGPFPNDRRRNLNTKFGPEAGVDLDASYMGKDGRRVQWEYLKTGVLKIEPPMGTEAYAIYYGATEVYSDVEREVWLATGSDDFEKIWINGELIWSSPMTPKPFKADEHVQLVKLNQGFNRILLRCENAGGTMGWCLLFCTGAG